MSFTYSSFISYRRNDGDIRFLKNFKAIIESEAQKVTNKDEVFFDEGSLKWGNRFDTKIYESIVKSYFFIPIYYHSYLHEENNWCAREIYHALEVEKMIHKSIDKDYCFILPIIFRGNLGDLPECICKINAKDIRRLETVITKGRPCEKLTKFKQDIYDTFHQNYHLLADNQINLSELCETIKIPTDEEIINWIKDQMENEKKSESANLPILKKNAL